MNNAGTEGPKGPSAQSLLAIVQQIGRMHEQVDAGPKDIQFPVTARQSWGDEYTIMDVQCLEEDVMQTIVEGAEMAEYYDTLGREIWWSPMFYLKPKESR